MQSEQIQILRNYKIHLKIPFGSGVSGNVYFQYLIKISSKTENIHPEAALNEFEVLEIIRDNPNKNLVKIYYVEWDKQNCKLYTIMERCQINLKIHGNLGTKFTQQESIDLLKQLVNGYKTLYENDIIHRDLKPSNILVEKCDIQTQYKICDFGISKKIKNEDYIIKIGTPYYCAPEINSNHMSLKLEQDFLECSKNFKKTINVCDMYSLGILMYELIVGELPHKKFNYNKIEEFYKTLNNGSFKMKAEVSEDLISLIMKMIQYYPSKRLKFDELLNHPLIREDQSQPKNSHKFQLKNSQQSSDQAQKIKFTNINYMATPQNTYNYNNQQLENENQIRKLVKIEAKYEFQPKQEYEFQLKQEYEFQPKQEYEFQPKQEYEFQPKQEFLQFNIQKQKTAEEIIQEGPRKQVKFNVENQIDQKTLAIDYFNQLLFQAEKLMTEQSIKHITELIQGLQNFDKEQTKAIININLYLPSRSIQSEKTSYSKFRDLFDPYYAKLRKYDISNELFYDNTSKNPSQFIKNNTFIQEKYQQNQQTYQSKFSNQLIVIENKDRLIIQDYFEDLLHQIQLMIQSKAKQYLIEFLEELKSNVCKAQTIQQIYNLLPNRDVFKEKKNYSQFRNIFEEICKKNMIIIQ